MGQFLSEQFPLLGVGNGQIQGATGGSHAKGANHQTFTGQFLHQVHKTLSFFAEKRGSRDAHVGEEQLGGIPGMLADLVQVAAFAEARQ